ncbi:hypothetical protein M378DRAFT_904366 [Amanita muscaria Koide BX008]|uniref:Uncharacterized protein n=1 Tax=Amanita muscaria (strain Koide BX008) TaxID=946122 RepID=A0A0C2SCW1_AMAMK|nr:hypothetical protein M378DRAFT_904366 [Amanita muscaria Koide BX008]
MDSQTTSPAAPDPLAATLHNATIDKAERNEFINTAHDMYKFVLNYHPENSRSAVPTGTRQAVENPVSGSYIHVLVLALIPLARISRRYQLPPKRRTTFRRGGSQERSVSINCWRNGWQG